MNHDPVNQVEGVQVCESNFWIRTGSKNYGVCIWIQEFFVNPQKLSGVVKCVRLISRFRIHRRCVSTGRAFDSAFGVPNSASGERPWRSRLEICNTAYLYVCICHIGFCICMLGICPVILKLGLQPGMVPDEQMNWPAGFLELGW